MKAKDNRSNINLNVPTFLKTRIQEFANKNGYTMTQAIVILLNTALEHYDIEYWAKEVPWDEKGNR